MSRHRHCRWVNLNGGSGAGDAPVKVEEGSAQEGDHSDGEDQDLFEAGLHGKGVFIFGG